MTIAELLVQTTAVLMNGDAAACEPDSEGVTAFKTLVWFAKAREIVVMVYGEPCDEFEWDPTKEPLCDKGLNDTPGATCGCGWPRSQHGAKP